MLPGVPPVAPTLCVSGHASLLLSSASAGLPAFHQAMSPIATVPSWQLRHLAEGPV